MNKTMQKGCKYLRYAIICLFIVTATIYLGGCSSQSGKVYTRSQAQQRLSVYFATVLTVRNVTIEGSRSGAGAIAGGVLGGIAANTVGGGTGRVLATAAGAIGGGLLGGAVEQGATTKDALEITVELDNGEIMAIVQEADDQYAVGDRVRVLQSSDGVMRIRQ